MKTRRFYTAQALQRDAAAAGLRSMRDASGRCCRARWLVVAGWWSDA